MGMDNKYSLLTSEHEQNHIISDQDLASICNRGSDKGDLTTQFRFSTGNDPVYDQGMVTSIIRDKNLKVMDNSTSQIVKNMSRVQHGRSYRDALTGERQ